MFHFLGNWEDGWINIKEGKCVSINYAMSSLFRYTTDIYRWRISTEGMFVVPVLSLICLQKLRASVDYWSKWFMYCITSLSTLRLWVSNLAHGKCICLKSRLVSFTAKGWWFYPCTLASSINKNLPPKYSLFCLIAVHNQQSIYLHAHRFILLLKSPLF